MDSDDDADGMGVANPEPRQVTRQENVATLFEDSTIPSAAPTSGIHGRMNLPPPKSGMNLPPPKSGMNPPPPSKQGMGLPPPAQTPTPVVDAEPPLGPEYGCAPPPSSSFRSSMNLPTPTQAPAAPAAPPPADKQSTALPPLDKPASAMSIKELKAVLDQGGVSYVGVCEKSELIAKADALRAGQR